MPGKGIPSSEDIMVQMNKTTNIKKNILAIELEAEAMRPNPKKPATTAIMRKTRV